MKKCRCQIGLKLRRLPPSKQLIPFSSHQALARRCSSNPAKLERQQPAGIDCSFALGFRYIRTDHFIGKR